METRREWLTTMRTGLMTAVVSPLADPRSSDEGPRAGQGGGRPPGSPERLSLDDFQPKSALHVPSASGCVSGTRFYDDLTGRGSVRLAPEHAGSRC